MSSFSRPASVRLLIFMIMDNNLLVIFVSFLETLPWSLGFFLLNGRFQFVEHVSQLHVDMILMTYTRLNRILHVDFVPEILKMGLEILIRLLRVQTAISLLDQAVVIVLQGHDQVLIALNHKHQTLLQIVRVSPLVAWTLPRFATRLAFPIVFSPRFPGMRRL